MAYTLGLDCSRWQDNNSTPQTMDFVKSYIAGSRFSMIKSSQRNWVDEDLLINWNNAKIAKQIRSAYHFLVWDLDAKTQAQYAYSLTEKDPGELPPTVDFEWWSTVPANAYDILWNYVVEMERLCGRKPIIYTGMFFWKTYGTQANVWQNYPLWAASYTDEKYMYDNMIKLTPWYEWKFWQFTASGDGLKFGAESKDLDLNWFQGSYDDLLKFAGLTTPPVPPTELNIEAQLDLILSGANMQALQVAEIRRLLKEAGL